MLLFFFVPVKNRIEIVSVEQRFENQTVTKKRNELNHHHHHQQQQQKKRKKAKDKIKIKQVSKGATRTDFKSIESTERTAKIEESGRKKKTMSICWCRGRRRRLSINLVTMFISSALGSGLDYWFGFIKPFCKTQWATYIGISFLFSRGPTVKI